MSQQLKLRLRFSFSLQLIRIFYTKVFFPVSFIVVKRRKEDFNYPSKAFPDIHYRCVALTFIYIFPTNQQSGNKAAESGVLDHISKFYQTVTEV